MALDGARAVLWSDDDEALPPRGEECQARLISNGDDALAVQFNSSPQWRAHDASGAAQFGARETATDSSQAADQLASECQAAPRPPPPGARPSFPVCRVGLAGAKSLFIATCNGHTRNSAAPTRASGRNKDPVAATAKRSNSDDDDDEWKHYARDTMTKCAALGQLCASGRAGRCERPDGVLSSWIVHL